jgi:hypothetical protein
MRLHPNRLHYQVAEKLGCRLLKKISEARRAKNRRAEAYLASTL